MALALERPARRLCLQIQIQKRELLAVGSEATASQQVTK